MKKMIPLFALALVSVVSVANVAFAGTEVSYMKPQASAEFFQSDVSNFRIVSVALGKAPIKVTDVVDEQCLATAETTLDCHHVTVVNTPVVNVNLEFDTTSGAYDEGRNNVTLSIERSQFTSNEIAQIRANAFSKSTAELVKLSVVPFKAKMVSADTSACSEYDGAFDCQAKAKYTSSNITKVRVSIGR